MRHFYYQIEPTPAPRWPLLLIIVGVVAVVLLNQCMVMPAYAHDDAILKCSNNVDYKSVTKLNETLVMNGLLDEHYSSQGNDMVDIHVLSNVTGPADKDGFIPHQANPIFWSVDLDFDGVVDKVYIDVHGEGHCDDIILYQDLTAPRDFSPEQPPTERRRDVDKRSM